MLISPDQNTRKVGWKKISLDSGTTKVVGLGVYSIHEREPKFDLTTLPEMGDEIGASPEKLDLPGASKYLLIYILHNFGEVPCNVTLRRIK